ncbi:hypothetical protein C0992_002270 [Termitomyces sp. T32_za158]|nr:hypothetical protein C0992_002270 [Termitomyces sp. T32_za158]
MSPQPVHVDLFWAHRTLADRHSTETLLAPEREAGNVSPHDYEAAVQFSQGPHRFYRLIGAFLAVPIAFAFRKPSWSPTRTYAFLVTSTLGGSLAGQALMLSAHINFLRSLENPSGFVQAIDNIRKNSSLGPTITRSDSKWAVDTDPTPTESSRPRPSTPDNPSANPPSKWDQIRAANVRPSTNSSWDALRQNHERTSVSSVSSDPDPDAFHRSRNQDRAAEQARFDDMLERERNIKRS